jgi:peptide/nickel transport system permease protein
MVVRVVRQLLSIVVTVWGVVTLVFLVVHLVPGDPARIMLGDYATPQAVAQLRHALGLDVPLTTAYARFLAGYLHGDFGRSFVSGEPVTRLIAERYAATLELAVAALLVAVVVGLPLGALAGVRRESLWDHVGSALALLGQSTPVFLTGLVFILVFADRLHWLPAIGAGHGAARDVLAHLVMPALALGAETTALIARMTRSSTLEVLGEDYVRTARAKGLPAIRVVTGHVLRNAAVPIVTIVGLNFGYLLGGAVITETVFARPGLGTLLVNGIIGRDYPVVQGTAFVITVSFIAVNLLVELSYYALNPVLRKGASQ